jgi:uncharacterized membrane protein YcaP (DUF421 family)
MLSPFIQIIVQSVGAIVFVVALTRVFGLRSFSKMSGFDFAVTVAIGSVVATTTMSTTTPFWQGALALATLSSV